MRQMEFKMERPGLVEPNSLFAECEFDEEDVE